MDGATKACWPIINAEIQHIVCAWCTAHVMDLLFEDIGKMFFSKEIWVQGKAIGIWIRKHQLFAAKFSKLASKISFASRDLYVLLLSCMFPLAGDTSFGVAFIMLSREIELQLSQGNCFLYASKC